LKAYLRKPKAEAALLLSLIILFSLSSAVVTVGEESEIASFSLQSYAPAEILISFSYTNNFSVTGVSSLGQSLYTITSSPTSIEFTAEDVDQYTFTVEIKYAVIVAQSLQIAVFSAEHAPEGLQLNVDSDVIRLSFTLIVTEEPQYPSAQDVAEQVVLQVANQLSEFRTQTTEIVDVQTRNIEMQWLLVSFTMVVSVAFIVILVLYVYPQMRRLRRGTV